MSRGPAGRLFPTLWLIDNSTFANDAVHRLSVDVGPNPFECELVISGQRLRDLKPELEQFAVDAWRAPKRIFYGHPPNQYAQLGVDLRSPSLWTRRLAPAAAKAGPMPTNERLGPDDREDQQDRRNPAVELDKEPAIIVRKPDATMEPTRQDH